MKNTKNVNGEKVINPLSVAELAAGAIPRTDGEKFLADWIKGGASAEPIAEYKDFVAKHPQFRIV